MLDKRSFLKLMTGFAVSSTTGPKPLRRVTSRGDDAFLDDLAERSCRFFWEQSDAHTGIARERVSWGRPLKENQNIGGTAVTGFGLAALCIGAARNWIDAELARSRVQNTLEFLAHRAPNERGWFYHCMDIKTGQRSGCHPTEHGKSELSSIDSAILMGGILTARQYFNGDAEIGRLAETIYRRMDFRWMLNGHPLLLAKGWSPEKGFNPRRWDSYGELTLLYLLGIGSPTYRLDPASWYAWSREENVYDGRRFIGNAQLFTHQYSHAFIDYRRCREAPGTGIDWFENSAIATRAHRQFCLDLSQRFPGYSDQIWGVAGSDSAIGHGARGGPPGQCGADGTVVPCAAAGSLMFTPDICVPALRAMHDRFGQKIYGRYGFVDAFHPGNGWIAGDYVGIDVGITLLAAENLRSGNVWKWFMANPQIGRGMGLANLAPA
jgi:hypothetical protein